MRMKVHAVDARSAATAPASAGLPTFRLAPTYLRRARAEPPRRSPRPASGRRACAGSPRRGGRPSASETKSRSAISALRSPSATRSRTSTSRVVRPAGFARVVARGPARQAAQHRSSRSRRATMRRGRPGTEALKRLERAAQSVLFAGLGERERRLVRAAELGPALARRASSRRRAEPPRARRPAAAIVLDARTRGASSELAGPPERATVERALRAPPRSRPRRRRRSGLKPGASALRRGDGRRPTAARPDAAASSAASSSASHAPGSPRRARTSPSTSERDDPRKRRPGVDDDSAERLGRLVPPPAVELGPGAGRHAGSAATRSRPRSLQYSVPAPM